MEPLRVSIVQADLVWEDAAANRRRLAERLRPLAGQTDLVVLPEMFTTGFSMRPEALAEPADGPTAEWMRERARELDAVVTGSFIAAVDGRYYNRLLWMPPAGEPLHYDKRHLFTYAGEHEQHAAGREHLLVTYRGWRILPLICYDVRFPVWSRNTHPYDLLLYVANFPARRGHAWRSLLTARAIENLCYTVAVNRVGNDGNGIEHDGDSGIIDYSGHWLAPLAGQEAMHTAVLDPRALADFRSRFAFLNDRDDFVLKNY